MSSFIFISNRNAGAVGAIVLAVLRRCNRQKYRGSHPIAKRAVSLKFPPILRVKEKAPTLRQEPLIYDKIPPRNPYRPVEIALPHVVKP